MSKNFASREVMNLIFCDYKTGRVLLNLDYANTTTTEVSSDNVFAYGGWGHPKRVAFNNEKEIELQVESQIRTFQLYSLITGANVTSGANFIQREVLTADSNRKLTLSKSLTDAATVNVFNEGDDCGTPLVVSTDYTVSVADNTIAMNATDAAGKSYIVYYVAALTGVKNLSIKSDVFPATMKIYGDTLVKTEAGQLVPYRMVVYKATPQTSLTLEHTNDGDPGTLQFTVSCLADENGNMIDLILEDDSDSASSPVRYTMTYDANGGTGTMASQTAAAGDPVTVSACGFTPPSGKNFDKWNTKADGTGTDYNSSASVNLTGSMTLYAQWVDS